ncbi:hypothetical protein ABZ896_11710 [Streptomyces sp. NPDC047072]|uniref:hypothetical protein n=1 Tax=Streptomyces sp. NPDC047072 TaxID=3154809 RepID=UPI0033C09E20
MPPSRIDPRLAEEQLAAALHNGILAIQTNTGSCTAGDITAHLVEQLTSGLLSEPTAAASASARNGQLDVDALVQTHYDVESTVNNTKAQVRFTPGLAASGLARGEHLDIRAEVSLKYRVELRFQCALFSQSDGADWFLAFTESDKSWLESAKTLKAPVGGLVTELAHERDHRSGLEPVVEAARHVAAMRALWVLGAARRQLASASTRALAARAAFDRYGYAAADLDRLAARLRQLAGEEDLMLIGW